MRGVTQVLQVKARLLASTMPDQVAAIARRVHAIEDPMALAALCLATFDGDAGYCDYALKKAAADDPPWVQSMCRARMVRGLPIDYPTILLQHMINLSKTTMTARGARL